MGLSQQGIGLVIDNLHPTPLNKLVVIGGVDGWSPSQNHTVILHIGFYRLDHRREVVLNLLLSRARQQGDDLLFLRGGCGQELAHLVG